MELILKYFPNLNKDQIDKFDKLESLYQDWNVKINVVSRKDIDELYLRHVLHSLGIAKLIEFKESTKILDVGTGGGFPGIPLAILFPESNFHLVDSIAKKLKVVDEVVTGLGITNVKTTHSRVETINDTYDFIQSYKYLKRKLSYGKFPKPATQWTKLIVSKIIYYSIWIVMPLFLGFVWWHVLIGFFIMHYTAGLILSVVFQLAHVMPNTEMPVPDNNGGMKNTWAIHQLFTTSNFAPKSWLVGFFTGGLNHQVEHHLYTNISHIHYKKIAKIVKQTAREFSLPYNEYKTFWKAIAEHYNQLKVMGQKPVMA